MKKLFNKFLIIQLAILGMSGIAQAKDTPEEYIKEFPNQEQVKMMTKWLDNNDKGTFQFSGLVDPTDDTVVTPQATVNYGYNWFSVSDAPAIINTPKYGRFFSVSIFDMKHNIPAVITSPDKPILIKRPGQTVPKGDFYVVNLETDQGLVFTRMVIVDNLKEVMNLSEEITMQGGKGDMRRTVQKFSEKSEKDGLAIIDTVISTLNPDDAFGKVSDDISFLNLAAGVKLGQLGTPSETVRYGIMLTDANGKALNGQNTYKVTVPANLYLKGGYYSVTLYGTDNQLLIENDLNIYDRTTYSSKINPDGTYTLTLSPSGKGVNGIPTGKDFYGILRAYVPNPEAIMEVTINKQ
ncbi:MAG: DUF1214 domain-containing protein [Psychromonas sp.]|nr:DUF1214 domain-containing protein [Psychromonas sp.]